MSAKENTYPIFIGDAVTYTWAAVRSRRWQKYFWNRPLTAQLSSSRTGASLVRERSSFLIWARKSSSTSKASSLGVISALRVTQKTVFSTTS